LCAPNPLRRNEDSRDHNVVYSRRNNKVRTVIPEYNLIF
jgi:hypothetical protein